MAGGGRPDEAVHTFLGRPGPRRSARTLADHLHPPRAAPRPPQPAPRPQPTTRPAPPPSPAAPAAPAARPAPRPAPSPAPRPAPSPEPAPEPAPVPAPVPAPEVGRARAAETRTVLDDGSPVTTLPAAARTGGTLRIALRWTPQVSAGGLRRSTDVHLGCLWETRDGHSGSVQALGGFLAAPGYGTRQVLRLGPRTEEEGEELLVDTRHLDVLRRVVLFLHGTRGAPDWAALDPHVTLRRRDGSRLQAWAGAPAPGARTCALLSVHDVAGDLVVRREAEWFTGPAAEVAAAYGFDVDWDPTGTVPRAS